MTLYSAKLRYLCWALVQMFFLVNGFLVISSTDNQKSILYTSKWLYWMDIHICFWPGSYLSKQRYVIKIIEFIKMIYYFCFFLHVLWDYNIQTKKYIIMELFLHVLFSLILIFFKEKYYMIWDHRILINLHVTCNYIFFISITSFFCWINNN